MFLYIIYISMEALENLDVLNENVLRYRLKGGASYIRARPSILHPFQLTHPTLTRSSVSISQEERSSGLA